MLPVCSTTPTCSSHSQIYFHAGLRPFSPPQKAIEIRGLVEEKVVLGIPRGIHSREVSFKPQATNFLHSYVIERHEQSGSMEFINISPYANELDDIELGFSNKWSYSIGAINEPYSVGMKDLNYVEISSTATQEDELLDVPDQFTQSTNILSGPATSETISTVDAAVGVVPENPTAVSGSLDMSDDASSKLKTNIGDFLSGFNKSIDASINKGERAVKTTLDAITSSLTDTIKTATEAVDSAVNNVLSTVDQSGDLAANRLTGFSADLKEATGNAGLVTIDGLRRAVVTVEDYLAGGAAFVVYSYGSLKELLPPEVQDVLNLSEEKAKEILRPVVTVSNQVYTAIEVLEKNLGLDPNDPIIPFALLLGTSATLGVSYWALTYGGYSGDLSPKSTLELLTGEKNVILIDIRPEDLRERDGVPDLRRGARFRYANLTLPEIGSSVRKLVTSGRDLDDAIIAAVIRDLKIVRDRSKVIVMDADGTRSKGIARSLRKLGVKRPYLVQGGFRSWVKSGLRIKELKPETTLTILNEEAEAILEDIKPTPVKIIGFGVGFVVVLCALLEWEKTLQLIGFFGLSQTIYWRVVSYEDPEDFQQDVRLLLAPVRLGVQAFSWAAGKLEPNRIGLPTSPSSSAVQNRVLQAAAKHESQPSDTEEIQDLSPESMGPVNENVDLSEA